MNEICREVEDRKKRWDIYREKKNNRGWTHGKRDFIYKEKQKRDKGDRMEKKEGMRKMIEMKWGNTICKDRN